MDLRPPLKVLAAKLADCCEGCGVTYALIGGYAAGAYAQAPDTRDVDACVDIAPDESARIEALLEALQAAGFRINVEALKRRAASGRAILFLQYGLVRLDVMLRKPDGYWDEALKHRRVASVEGRDYWIASPEDLILLKLIAGREKDYPTVELVAATQLRRLDLERLRAGARRLAAKVPELPEQVEAVLLKAAEIDRLASLPPGDEQP